MRILACILFSILLSSCSPEPRSINYVHDHCHFCEMKIMDERYGAESVTQKGKVYTYDSGECLLNYLRKARPEDEYYSYLLVTDFLEPGTLIDAHKAYFLVSPNMPSPMGGDLNAFQSKEQAENLLEKNGGKLFSWSEISEDYSFDSDL